MEREQLEVLWESLRCPVCGGEMGKKSKKYALLSQDFFSRNSYSNDKIFETFPYVCEDCGCAIFRKVK